MDTVTFTCTAAGDTLRWQPSDLTSAGISILSSSNLNETVVVSGYTVTLIAVDNNTDLNTTLTSTLSRTAENGITVSCVGFMPVSTIGSSIISLVGELPFIYKVSC